MRELCKLVKINKDDIYRLVRENRFPKPLPISARKWRWLVSDIEDWIVELKEQSRSIKF